jgi:copper(I)-binding protein
MSSPLQRSAAALTLSVWPFLAVAQISVQEPWVRATVAQQKATGAFMQLVSPAGGRLVSASSPVAGVVEIHEMAMDGNVMKMRAIAGLDLPAGKAVALKPGGHHVMLMDLKQGLQTGQSVPITLVVEGPGGKRETVQISATVRPLGAAPAPGHGAHKH